MERDDRDLDCYLDEVHGCARMLDEEKDRQVYEYYCSGGWIKNVADD